MRVEAEIPVGKVLLQRSGGLLVTWTRREQCRWRAETDSKCALEVESVVLENGLGRGEKEEEWMTPKTLAYCSVSGHDAPVH